MKSAPGNQSSIKMIIGIDNGLNGGIVALSPLRGLAPIAKFAMPMRLVTYPPHKSIGPRESREIDVRALIAILDQIEGPRDYITVYFETCPLHADRAETMRSMALSAGKILAILEAKGFQNIKRIFSYHWHPEMLGKIPKGQSKVLARAKAAELWPDESWMATERSRVPHDGMIDAALIAEYGRRQTYFPTVSTKSDASDQLPW